jgi:hypothetical protein
MPTTNMSRKYKEIASQSRNFTCPLSLNLGNYQIYCWIHNHYWHILIYHSAAQSSIISRVSILRCRRGKSFSKMKNHAGTTEGS